MTTPPTIEARAFQPAFTEFRELYAAQNKGEPFTNFHTGFAPVWEDYKPRLRDRARTILAIEAWSDADIGTGEILRRTIDAIEIQDTKSNLINNLVFWQNRFGHANRDHHALLDARKNVPRRKELERLLFGLYRGGENEGELFDRLTELTERKYPLLAYLFFVKDIDRFAPIQPTGFDRAFKAIGIPFTTLQQCNWQNDSAFVALLTELRTLIASAAKLVNVSLIDAHSFCWIYATLLNVRAEGALGDQQGGKDSGRVIEGREKSIIDMRTSILQTVANSNGQTVPTMVKNKDLGVDEAELDGYLRELLDQQGNRCALTGIPLQFSNPLADKNLLPSADRIDSKGHYVKSNIQVVCRFINFWKGASNNEEFQRLLILVRDPETV
jgi:hypothetical protein